NVADSGDPKKLTEVLKSFIEASHGVRSDDGAEFIKSTENWLRFKGSGAYDVFFLELFETDNAMAEFVRGIIPKELREAAEEKISNADISVEAKYEQFLQQGMSEAEARSRANAARSHLPAQAPQAQP